MVQLDGSERAVPWLVREDKVLATLEIADGVRDRARGLLGRDGVEGAVLLRPARSVHTFGMRFAIDVAFLDRDLRVLRMLTMPRNRVSLPVWRARAVVEAEAGAFGSWGLRLDDQLEVRGDRESS
jgi:uncharacterized membrane protein (UPF0127 family)